MSNKQAFLIFPLLLFFLAGAGCDDTSSNSGSDNNDNILMSTLWMQSSAEYRALCYQTFDLAGKILIDNLQNYAGKKKPALVIDLDETVLDNSPYEAWTIKTGNSYPAGWQEWCDLGKAGLVPGAREFLDRAEKKKVEIFYISNRRESTREGTIRNLRYLNLPNTQDKYVLLRTDDSSKEPRREQVMGEHEILLLLGDNLQDFSNIFANEKIQRRKVLVDSLRAQFGSRFIVLPNAMYGPWDAAVLGNDFTLTKHEQNEKRKAALRAFDFIPKKEEH